jgi:HSP20 family protein|tara:strand:+ start:2463 stop:2942 length:480 start_codon:yes stop_codon:yes gene_type:complete
MSIVRYKVPALRPFAKDDFVTPFDKLIDEVFANNFPELTKDFGVGFFEKQSYPRVDVVDYSDRIEVVAEIPGLDREEVSVDIEENLLIISGQKAKTIDDNNNKTYVRKELKHSSFKRAFVLSDLFDKDTPSAKFENGLLTVTVKKVKPSLPTSKKVKIT